jgi:hypothetical protein
MDSMRKPAFLQNFPAGIGLAVAGSRAVLTNPARWVMLTLNAVSSGTGKGGAPWLTGGKQSVN